MIKNQLYERPDITVLHLEESCGLLAGSDTDTGKKVTKDGKTILDGYEEGNPTTGIDAKKNNTWGTNGIWND